MALVFLSPLHKAIRQIGIHLGECMKCFDVQPSEGHLISYLRSYAPCPISELTRVFGHKKSTLTSMIDRLEKRGLLTREPHPDDRRSVLVRLTRPGGRLAEKIQRPVEELERRIGSKVTESDLRGFRRVMQAVEEVTEVEVKPKRKERVT